MAFQNKLMGVELLAFPTAKRSLLSHITFQYSMQI